MTSLGLWLPIATAPSSSSSLNSIVKLHSFLWFRPFDTGRRRWVKRTGRWSQVDCFNSIHSVGCYRRLQCLATNGRERESGGSRMFGSSDEEVIPQVPTQLQSVVEGSGAVLVSEPKPIPDLDYLQELLAIQQQGPRAIGFFGTRNMGFMHQQLIEILSYAMVITKNHIFTSGASGTNAAVIRGAVRAEKPELLTVILPQSLKMQPPESQELLSKRLVVYHKVIDRLAQCIKHSGVLTYELVQLIFMSIPFSCKNLVEGVYDITGMVKNVIEKPQNDHLPLIEASRIRYAPNTSSTMLSSRTENDLNKRV